MKPSQLTIALETCINTKQPVVVWGEPGIFKSAVVHQTAERMKLDMQDVRAVLLDPVDLRGLPTVDKEGRAKWAIPDFLPRSGSGILFLDELNRAPALVQNACFQLVLDRKLGEYTLPKDWAIVAACNPSGGGITKMSPALKNRFVHLYAEVDVADWCKWANNPKNKIEPVVVAFIRFRSELLHKPDANADAFPTPRSWEFVSKITAADPGNGIAQSLFEGAVGQGAATEYGAFLSMFKDLPNIDAILLNPKSAEIPKKAATLYAVSSALARRMTDSNIARIIEYANRLPQEYAVLIMKDAVQRDSTLTATSEFTKWSVANQEVFS